MNYFKNFKKLFKLVLSFDTWLLLILSSITFSSLIHVVEHGTIAQNFQAKMAINKEKHNQFQHAPYQSDLRQIIVGDPKIKRFLNSGDRQLIVVGSFPFLQ